jgi:tRNA 2-thiouridine synthesizing protein B
MMLHTVNKSPFENNNLDACLRFAASGSAVLLMEDGIYAALKGTAKSDQVAGAMASRKLYVLGPDLAARGFGDDQVIDGIQVVDYAGFVDLATEYDKVQAWL